MPHLTKQSYEKINYALRPSKQVERKLFIETLQHLGKSGYNIPNYVYIGFGSVYYVDFILFHKYLHINDMICVEKSTIPKRMKFNRPYKFIKLKMKPVSELLPDLDIKKKYIVWLDYDEPLSKEILADIAGFTNILPEKSILIITVDAEPSITGEYEFDHFSIEKRISYLRNHYFDVFGELIPEGIKNSDVKSSNVPHLFAKAISRHLQSCTATRQNITFLQLFNYSYSDGTQMLTIGGTFENESNKEKFLKSDIYNLNFIQVKKEPIRISVPPLTNREKLWLDSEIDLKGGLISPCFEISPANLENYLKYYKYYPSYHEILI